SGRPVPVRDHLRDPRRSRTVVPRPGPDRLDHLGDDSQRSAVRSGARPGGVVVVRAAGHHDRAARMRSRVDQLRDRRGHQSETAHSAGSRAQRASGREDEGGRRMSVNEKDAVLTARDVSIEYEVDPPVKAVRNVSLTLHRGEILGLAGESGCGKTTLAYGLNRLLKAPALMTGGEIVFHDRDGDDIDIVELEDEGLRAFRWDKISMVFQGAMNSLNPVISVKAQIFDVFDTHRPGMSRRAKTERAEELLRLVGVDPSRLTSFPHELSGGMRQRVMIAMALALDPQVMIMDEPTTALDVVVQRGIIREIMRLRERLGFAVS